MNVEATSQPVVEQLSKMGVAALQEVGNWVKAAKDFSTEQAPLVVNEILKWGICKSIIPIIIGILMIAIGAYIIYRMKKWGKANLRLDRESPGYVLPIVFSIIGMMSGFLITCLFVYDLCYVLFAPRLYIIEYLSKLVK